MPLYTSPALLAPGGGMAMAPVIVGSGTSFFSSSGLTGYSVSHTVPSEANCLALAVGYCKQNGAHQLTDASWNGAALTPLKTAGGIGWTAGRTTVWVGAIADPPAGTFDIVVNMSVAPDNLALYALNLAGVDAAQMAAASEGAATVFFNASALSATLDPAPPSLIFGGMALAQPPGPASYTPGSGVTELIEGTASGPAAAHYFFGYRRETIDGRYDFAAACTQSSSCSLAAVAFKGS